MDPPQGLTQPLATSYTGPGDWWGSLDPSIGSSSASGSGTPRALEVSPHPAGGSSTTN